MKSIYQLSQEIYKNNIEKGFHDTPNNLGEMLCMIHSEVSEALESDRKSKYCVLNGLGVSMLTETIDDDKFKADFEEQIKGSFEDELADIVIRVFGLSAYKNIDLMQHIEAKMRYNKLRPHKHGKKY